MPYEDESAQVENSRRRQALRVLGGSALTALAASAVASRASAEINSTLKLAVTQNLTLRKLNAAQIKALKLSVRMAPSTTITGLGLTPEGTAKLTPRAKLLTKKDLIDLGQGTISTPNTQGLTVTDVASIREAFGTEFRPALGKPGLNAADVSCCCCTPCCCAAAVSPPQAIAA